MRTRTCLPVVLGALLLCGTTRAEIIFSQDNLNQDVDNVLFNQVGAITSGHFYVVGLTQAGTAVTIESNEDLKVNHADSGGAATVSAVVPGFAVADIFLTVPPGGVYTKLVFGISGWGTGQRSQVPFTITATEGNGTTQSDTFTTGSGDTFYTVVAITGQDIRTINLQADTGYEFDELKQVRIGGVHVPDGGFTAMFLGAALVSLETLRRRFRA